VVDEAHHLAWTPTHVSPGYALVEDLAQRSPGLLLLTATPTQLGLEGHFARLRLLDPHRYDDYARFLAETEQLRRGGRDRRPHRRAQAARREGPRRPEAHLHPRSGDASRHLDALAQRQAGRAGGAAAHAARPARHRAGDVPQHARGHGGFSPRQFCPAPLQETNVTQLARLARELRAEETGDEAAVRYSFKEDVRLDWLVGFLREDRARKALVICRSQRKAIALEAALPERINVKVALFHEGLPLVQRDRQAAWFAEPDGAQLLICSEIGSEGRNFQFAHHLVLFDLPLNPGLLEQRIGRLDRIGQTETIRIHVPYVQGSAEEVVVEWYHRGLDAFEAPLHGGSEFEAAFRVRVVELAVNFAAGGPTGRAALDALLADTIAFREKLARRLQQGRDRLLELNSFDREAAEAVLTRIREADADPHLRRFLVELLDHFGVRIREHEEGDLFLDPSHAYVESFPSLPADGMLATFDRRRAIAREDIRFLSADHSLVQDAIDLLLESKAGTTAFGAITADEPALLLEAVFVLEPVADTRWHVDEFLAPTPVRVVVDLRGDDCTAGHPAAAVAADFEDREIHRFLEQPGFNAELLRQMLAAADEHAGAHSRTLRQAAAAKAEAALGAGLARLVDLQRLNDHVRPEEIELAREQLAQTRTALEHARLRLDSLRLLVAGPPDRD
jgi:ATP-dependent helicase HepA